MFFNLCCHSLSSTVLICSAFCNVLQHVPTRFDMFWSCLITFDHVWSCLIMFAVLVIYNFSCQFAVLTCLQSYRSLFPDRAAQEQLDVLEKTVRQSITKYHVRYEDMMINHQILARGTHHTGKSRSFSHRLSPWVFQIFFCQFTQG